MKTNEMAAASQTRLLFSVCTLAGALIWLLSETLTGHREPWDASPIFYLGSLFFAGFIPACFTASRYWLWPLGVLLGQKIGFVALLREGAGPLWMVGILFLSFYSLISLLGARMGVACYGWLHQRASIRASGKDSLDTFCTK